MSLGNSSRRRAPNTPRSHLEWLFLCLKESEEDPGSAFVVAYFSISRCVVVAKRKEKFARLSRLITKFHFQKVEPMMTTICKACVSSVTRKRRSKTWARNKKGNLVLMAFRLHDRFSAATAPILR